MISMNHDDTDFQERVEHLLTRHGFALPLLTSGDSAEFVFFTYDINHRMRFLSESFWSICRIKPEKWIYSSFESRMSSHRWNQSFFARVENGKYPQGPLRCELMDDLSVPVKLQVWRSDLHLDGKFVGEVGIGKKYLEIQAEPSRPLEMDLTEIRQRIDTLSKGEKEVVDLVIAGHLNKMIAKKLDIAMRTVESRRARAMTKMGVSRLADLVRIWLAVQEAKP